MATVSTGGPGDLVIADALPVLLLRDVVVFPLTAVPLAVAEPRSIRLVDDVICGTVSWPWPRSGRPRSPRHPTTCTGSPR
jgi:hypothetical protein